MHRLGAFEAREPLVEALKAVRQMFVIQAEGRQDGGMEITDMHLVHCRFKSDLVGFPVMRTASRAAARQPDCKCVRIMIAPRLVALLGNRQAPEFAPPDDESLVQ